MITNKKRICTVPYCTEPTFLLSISSRLFFLLHSPVSPFHLIAVTTCCCHQIIHACLYNTSLFFFFFPLLLFFSDHKKKDGFFSPSPSLPLLYLIIVTWFSYCSGLTPSVRSLRCRLLAQFPFLTTAFPSPAYVFPRTPALFLRGTENKIKC